MRVLFVSALPAERSSMIGRILPLARAVAAAGHDVALLTLSGRPTPPFDTVETIHGVHVRTVGPALRATDVRDPSLGETVARLQAGRRTLTRALEEERADVVVLAKPQLQNTPPALACARRRGIPLILDTDDLEAVASRLPWPARAYTAWLERRAARAATLITACSPFLVERFRRLNPTARVPPSESASRIELLPTGIEVPPDVPPVELRERLSILPAERIILYVGSLSISSGHRVDLLIDAFTHWTAFPLPRLVLAGDGLDVDRLNIQAHRSPAAPRIHFLGRFTPPSDIALAQEADLLVDPVDRTPTNEAKSSHRTMLALATGTPVVAGDVGIRRFLLRRSLHTTCLYDPDDPTALSRAIARGLDPACRERFRRETTGLINQWTSETLGKHFASLLEKLR